MAGSVLYSVRCSSLVAISIKASNFSENGQLQESQLQKFLFWINLSFALVSDTLIK